MSLSDTIAELFKNGAQQVSIAKPNEERYLVQVSQRVTTNSQGDFVQATHQTQAMCLINALEQALAQVRYTNLKPQKSNHAGLIKV